MSVKLPDTLKSKKMKKLGIIFLVILGVLLITAVVLPLVVNIDTFRPKIVDAINQKIQGKVEIGHLKLRLLGGIGAEIDGVQLFASKNFEGKEILSVQNARVKTSLISLITGKPNVTLILKSPKLNLVKNKENVWNVVDVAKINEESVTAPSDQKNESKKELPKIVRNAKFNLKMKDAVVTLNDIAAGSSSTVKNLDLELYNVALNSPISFKISMDATGDYKKYKIKGILATEGKVKVKFKDKDIEDGFVTAKFDCKNADIEQTGIFRKDDGIPCSIDVNADIKNNILSIGRANVVLHTLQASVKGKVSGLTTEPSADLVFSMNKVKLKEWDEILFALKKSPISALVSLNFSMKGPIKNPELFGSLDIRDGSGKISGIAPSISNLNGDLSLKGKEIIIEKLSFNAGGNPVNISGRVTDFASPYVEFSLSTPSLDIDNFFEKGGSKSSATHGANYFASFVQSTAYASESTKSSGGQNLGLLNKLRGKGNIKIGKLKVGKAVLSNFIANATVGGGSLSLAQTASAWGGGIRSTTMLTSSGNYSFDGSVDNLNLVTMAKEFGSKEAAFKGFLFGNLNVSGAGLTMNDMNRNLTGSGSVRVNEGEIADLNVGRQVKSALATISMLGGAPIHKKDFDQKFQKISADINIGGGKISTNNAVAMTSEIEMLGTGYATLAQALNFNGTVYVPPDFVAIRGIDLTDKTGKVPIPFQLTGTASNPKFELDVAKLAAHIAIKVAESEIKKRVLGIPGDTPSGATGPSIPGTNIPIQDLFKK